MKLSEEALDEGRKLIIAGDGEGFAKWVEANKIVIDTKNTWRTLEMRMRAGDVQRALRLFDIVFSNVDPDKDARKVDEAGVKFAETIAAIAKAALEDRIATLEAQVAQLTARVAELEEKST